MITLPEIIERDKRPPSVTVSMTCYNHAKYLDEAIRSVLMQKTNFPVNIVIHDDASTDGSADIIRKYAAENPNITPILQSTNMYQNGKPIMPFMLPHYTSKYIAYLECDDFLVNEHKLQMQLDYMERNPDCSGVYANIMPVNKFGIRDETARYEVVLGHKGGFPKTGEGDYPLNSTVHYHHIGTLLFRNIWQFMTPEELAMYINNRTTGDAKILALLSHLGRVHYFAEELSAYRRAFDEGDSYTARMARMNDYDKSRKIILGMSDNYLMLERLLGNRKYAFRKYLFVLLHELKSRIKYHRSIIDDANLDPSYHLKNIPCYVWAAFPVYAAYRVIRKIIQKLRPAE